MNESSFIKWYVKHSPNLHLSASYCLTFPVIFYAVKALKFSEVGTQDIEFEDKCDTVLVIMKKGFERRFCADADCICQFNFFCPGVDSLQDHLSSSHNSCKGLPVWG